jgi:uncharacterized membrane protein YkvA (DUF1232 family)
MWIDVLIGLVGALLVSWLALVVALVLMRPKGNILRETLRILPDLRLLKNLATDRTQPKSVRIRLGLLMAYLPSPIDLIPDFVPVLGYADDAIIVVAMLRSVVRRVGIGQVRVHWTGTDDGFNALYRAAGSPADQQATRRNHPLDSPGCTAK